jgi:hypothetical protein
LVRYIEGDNDNKWKILRIEGRQGCSARGLAHQLGDAELPIKLAQDDIRVSNV